MFDVMDFDGPGTGSDYELSGPYLPESMDCMRCGQCISRCPTYQLTHDEQEGPRQRVRTLSRLLVECQPVTDEAVAHLQNCLQCRACEAVCPSKMDYAECFDQARAQLAADRQISPLARLGLSLIANKRLFNALLPLIKIYRSLGLRKLLRAFRVFPGGLKRVDDMAPAPVLSALKPSYPLTQARGTVALFTGCIGDHFDRSTLVAAIKVLNRIGYSVLVPKTQACCGAIHYHNGAQQTAKALMSKNVEVFGNLAVDAIVYCATGCGSHLQEYRRILERDDDEAAAFTEKLVEITDFVDRHWPLSLPLTHCQKNAKVHEPCSQRNVLKNSQAVYRLLQRIPGLEVTELTDNQLCCGAAGTYMLTHPETADTLRDLKWQQVPETEIDYLVTSNIGCALHLATAQRKNVDIVHPMQIVAAHLPEADAVVATIQ